MKALSLCIVFLVSASLAASSGVRESEGSIRVGDASEYFAFCDWLETGRSVICYNGDVNSTAEDGALILSYNYTQGVQYSVIYGGEMILGALIEPGKDVPSSCLDLLDIPALRLCLVPERVQMYPNGVHVCFTSQIRLLFFPFYTVDMNCFDITLASETPQR